MTVFITGKPNSDIEIQGEVLLNVQQINRLPCVSVDICGWVLVLPTASSIYQSDDFIHWRNTQVHLVAPSHINQCGDSGWGINWFGDDHCTWLRTLVEGWIFDGGHGGIFFFQTLKSCISVTIYSTKNDTHNYIIGTWVVVSWRYIWWSAWPSQSG